MALSSGYWYSYSRPEFARVTHIHLDLNVDFNRKVLKGKAVLTIKKVLPSIDKVVLDSYGLVISSVRNMSTLSYLKHHLGYFGIYGSKFTIELPQMVEGTENRCKIEIEYETSPISPALHWLEQTVQDTHPFLLPNNMDTIARAVFPCQDTPSVMFTYSATIVTPLDFTVLMSAPLSLADKDEHKCSYTFFQNIPMPSHAVILAVGVLQQYKLPNSRISMWFSGYRYPQITSIDILSLLQKIETLLKSTENMQGAYPWNSLNILLPPSVLHFKIKCPCLTFVSPLIIRDHLLRPISMTVFPNWTGMLLS